MHSQNKYNMFTYKWHLLSIHTYEYTHLCTLNIYHYNTQVWYGPNRNGLEWYFWTIGYCVYRKCQTKILSFLCTNKYSQTPLNTTLLPFNDCLQYGWIFVQILVNPHNNSNKTNIYIHLGGRHCSKHSACLNSLHSHINSPKYVPLSPLFRWRNRLQRI